MHKRTKMNKNVSAFSSVGLPTLFIYCNHPQQKRKKKETWHNLMFRNKFSVFLIFERGSSTVDVCCIMLPLFFFVFFFCLCHAFASSSTFCLAAEEWRRPHQTEGCHSSSRGRSGGRSRLPPNPKLQYGYPMTMSMQQEDEQETKEERQKDEERRASLRFMGKSSTSTQKKVRLDSI